MTDMQFLENIFKIVYIGLAIFLLINFMAIFSNVAFHDSANEGTEGLGSRAAEVIKDGIIDPIGEFVQAGFNSTGSRSSSRVSEAERANSQMVAERQQRIRSLPAVYPVSGRFNISSGFGYRRDPISRQTRFHNGIDIPIVSGSRVLATGNGVVTQTGYDRFLGYFVIINHQESFQSIYGHLSRIHVRAGDRVQQGQAIALSGNTGRSTGPHLHYQINYRGKPVDPVEVVKVLNEL